jgi:hypothetical protein
VQAASTLLAKYHKLVTKKIEHSGDMPFKPVKQMTDAEIEEEILRTLRGYLVHRSRPLPCYRVGGGKILIKRSEFDAWMQGFRVAELSQVDAIVKETLAGL